MKKFNIVFDSVVPERLASIFDYLVVNESTQIAHLVLDSLEKSIFSLETFPNRFPEIGESYKITQFEVRNIFCSSFRIMYVVLDAQVRILDVRHLAMEPLSKEDLSKYL